MKQIPLKDNRINTFFEQRDPNDILGDIKGDRFKEYRQKWADSNNMIMPDYPLHIDFELSNKCNLRCKICALGVKEFEQDLFPVKDITLPREKIEEIILDGVKNGLYSMGINYYSEPLMRDDTIDIVKFAMDNGIVDTWFTTNGTLLNKEKSIKILESGCTRLNISVDAYYPSTYKFIRGGSLEKLHDNINQFLELKAELGYKLPLVRLSLVRTRINQREVDKFKELWKDKVDYVAIQEFECCGKMNEWYHPDDMFQVETKDFVCRLPSQRLVIRYNGDVLPCCTFFSRKLVMGNIYQKSIKEIWNDAPLRYLREMQLAGRYKEIPACLECVPSTRKLV